MLAILIALCTLQQAAPESNKPPDLSKVASQLEDIKTVDSGLIATQQVLKSVEPDDSADWKRIIRQCNILVQDADSQTRQKASQVLAQACQQKPELASEFLESLLIRLDWESRAQDRGREMDIQGVIDAIGNLSLSSGRAAQKLRKEVDFEKRGRFISIRAASVVAKISPSNEERTEMVNWLLQRITKGDEVEKSLCADGLGQLPKGSNDSKPIVKALRTLLHDSDASARATAARAIWRLSGESTVKDDLVSILGENEVIYVTKPLSISELAQGQFMTSHCLAISALKEMKVADAKTIEAIARRLQSDNDYTSFHAVIALDSLIGSNPISEATQAHLQQASKLHLNPVLRKTATEILSRTQSK